MNKLRSKLFAAMEPKQIFHAPVWGNPRAMSVALREVRKAMSGVDGGLPSVNLLQESLRRFSTTQTVGNFTELKYVCYGITVPVGENKWRLIDREPLFNSLLGLVEKHSGQPKQYRRCYQGLLTGYFGFDKLVPSESGQPNWVRLRSYLDQRLAPIVERTQGTGVAPDWLQTLASHKNLLTEDPCSRYAHKLQQGNRDELQSLCAALGIASTSWVWSEALMAYVRAVCDGGDRVFQQEMAGVLDLVNGRADLKLAEMLCTRATALTVVRYARCAEKPEHPELRDTGLRWIGNPWVNRTAWDAHVQHEPARQMIEGWLKRRLIKDFFELLAIDGGADLRRLNYWLKWEPQISDMWFVLGHDARANKSEAFEDLRKRMVGRRRSLDDNNPQNNAFVMRIGPLLVIEFGATNNACYAFAAADFRADLEKPLLSVHALKQRIGAQRLSHSHAWEGRFDYDLKRMLQSVPSSKGQLPTSQPAPQPASLPVAWPSAATQPAPASSNPRPSVAPRLQVSGTGTTGKVDLNHIKARCAQHGIEWEDHLSNNGAFWVLMGERKRHPGFAALLDSLGFKYYRDMGFSIKF